VKSPRNACSEIKGERTGARAKASLSIMRSITWEIDDQADAHGRRPPSTARLTDLSATSPDNARW